MCLLSEGDLTDAYWPRERKEPLKVTAGGSQLEVTLQSARRTEKGGGAWTERIFTLMNKAHNMSRVVIHVQLNDYGLVIGMASGGYGHDRSSISKIETSSKIPTMVITD